MNYEAVVGSREWKDHEAVSAHVKALPKNTVVVTGAWWAFVKGYGWVLVPTRGVDYMASVAANAAGLTVVVVAGSPKAHDKLAGLKRNPITVDIADKVTAFSYRESRGTANTVKLAQQAGKPVEIIRAE